MNKGKKAKTGYKVVIVENKKQKSIKGDAIKLEKQINKQPKVSSVKLTIFVKNKTIKLIKRNKYCNYG